MTQYHRECQNNQTFRHFSRKKNCKEPKKLFTKISKNTVKNKIRNGKILWNEQRQYRYKKRKIYEIGRQRHLYLTWWLA